MNFITDFRYAVRYAEVTGCQINARQCVPLLPCRTAMAEIDIAGNADEPESRASSPPSLHLRGGNDVIGGCGGD